MTERTVKGNGMSMTRTVSRAIVALTAIGFVVAAGRLTAIERKPLPSLTLADAQGQPVSNDALPSSGKWLLLYIEPKCEACETLLRAIDVKAQPALPSHLLIVVGRADGPATAAMAARYPDLVNARWLSDQGKSVMQTLKLPGAPVVVGLRKQTIEWSIAGLVPSIGGVKSALVSWAGER